MAFRGSVRTTSIYSHHLFTYPKIDFNPSMTDELFTRRPVDKMFSRSPHLSRDPASLTSRAYFPAVSPVLLSDLYKGGHDGCRLPDRLCLITLRSLMRLNTSRIDRLLL